MAQSSNIELFSHKKRANNRSKKLNFVTSLWPFYLFSRSLGLLPFSVKFDSNGEIKKARVSAFDFLWFGLAISLYLSLTLFYFGFFTSPQEAFNHNIPKNTSYILYFGDSIFNLYGLVYGAIVIIIDMCNRHRLVHILKEFTTFEKEVRIFGVQMDYKKQKHRTILWYTVNLAIVLTMSGTPFLSSKPTSYLTTFEICIFYIIHLAQYCLPAIIASTYCFAIFRLCDRFNMLNSLLRKQFLSKNRIMPHKDDSIAYIKHMGRLHNMLCGIMDKLNFCYAFQVMAFFGSGFIFTIFTYFSFYRYIRHQNDDIERSIRFHINLEIFFSFYGAILIYAGSLIAREGKKTAEVLHDVINSCNDADVVASLAQVSLQIQHRYPVATCGLFVFDWTLTYSLIGSVATYLTILIQFDSP